MRNEILNGDFSDSFNNWLNGVMNGYPFSIDNGKAKASSYADSESSKTHKLRQRFSIFDLLLSGVLSVYAEWQIDNADYEEEFDSELGDEWTKKNEDADRTITVADGILTIEIKNGVDARWWCEVANEAPKIYRTIPGKPCDIITKLNSYTVNDGTRTGVFIGTDPDGLGGMGTHLAYLWARQRHDGGLGNGLILKENCATKSIITGEEGTTLPMWLKISVADNGDITFWYSHNGTDYTQYEHGGGPYVLSDYYSDSLKIGLSVENIAGNENVAIPFEFFRILYKGKTVFTVNLIKPSNSLVQIGTWEKTTDGSGNLLSSEDILANLDEYGNYYLELVCEVESAYEGGSFAQSFGWYDNIILNTTKKLKKVIFEDFFMGEKPLYMGGKKTLTETMLFKETVTRLKIDNQDPNWEEISKDTSKYIKEKTIIK